MIIMGVDPGVNGGVAILTSAGFPVFVRALKPDMTQQEAVAVMRDGARELMKRGGEFCFIEKVGVMPRDGRKGANTFGRIDGILRGAAIAFGLTVKNVAPVIWQSKLDCLTGGNKNVSKKKAQELFAECGIKITHNTADALLIAEYGRRSLGGV